MLGAEMCLFKYDADTATESFGRPLPGPPHALYHDPQAADAARRPLGHAIAAGAGAHTVLNRGKPLRPKEDDRGWKWRESLRVKRDESLIFASESQVVRVERRNPAAAGERQLEP